MGWRIEKKNDKIIKSKTDSADERRILMSNQFIRMQCENMLTMIETFRQSCEMAARQDDGKVSKEEEKFLKKMNKAADQFADILRKA